MIGLKATLFIVVSKHPMFEVGTVFETSLLRDGNRLGFYDNHGRLCVLDDSIRSLSEVVKLSVINLLLSLNKLRSLNLNLKLLVLKVLVW